MLPDPQQLLQQQQLREPSPRLDQRMEALWLIADNQPLRPFTFPWWRRMGVRLAVAAAIIAALGLAARYGIWQPNQPTNPLVETPNTPVEQPANNVLSPLADGWRIEQVESELDDLGVVVDETQGPLRQYRQRTVQRITYIDPDTDESFNVEVPSERIVLVKATIY